jgi:hypothetical protein
LQVGKARILEERGEKRGDTIRCHEARL